jgi:hypothetical protein
MDKGVNEVGAQRTASIETSVVSLEAIRALAQRRRMPGASWPTEMRPPMTALMGAR